MIDRMLLSSLLIALLGSGCDESNFASADAAGQAYQVRVEDTPEVGSDATSTTSPDPDTAPNTDTTKEVTEPAATTAVIDESVESCAKLSGVKSQQVKVNGSAKDIKLTSQQPLALKVTGNQNQVSVDLTSQPPETQVKAICLFVTGNQNKVNIAVGLHVRAVYVDARGNNPKIEIVTNKSGIIDSISMDARGNGGQLILSGDGKFPCDKTNAGIVCQ